MRALARRHGIRPSRALGQNFLIDPNLARAVAELAGVAPRDDVVEIGAGLGSLTVALASTGARVLAVELDRALLPALGEAVASLPNVEVARINAMAANWPKILAGRSWRLVSNLPYNIATPLLLDLLSSGAPIRDYHVMVQREVGERLAARPRDAAYGAVSVKVAYLAETELLRRVPPSVFWPRPRVESVLVRIVPRPDAAALASTPAARRLRRLVDAGFAERRKTMRNALRRLGLSRDDAIGALADAGYPAEVRAEEIDVAGFERLSARLRHAIDVAVDRPAHG